MANNITVLNSTGGTVTLMSVETSTGVQIMQSLPSNSAGNPGDFGAGVASSATMRFVLSSNPTVIPSSVQTVTMSSNPTVILSSNPTVILSSVASVTPSSVVTVTLSSAVSATATPIQTSKFTVTAASGTNSTLVSSASSTLYSACFYNNGSSAVFVKLYNLSSAPTAGTSTLMFNIAVSPGISRDVFLTGMLSSIGIGYTITGAITSTDTTSVAANDIVGIIEYA